MTEATGDTGRGAVDADSASPLRLRAVFDTQIFLKILLARKPLGVASAIWELLQQGQAELVTSRPLLARLRETLLVPELADVHRWSPARIAEYMRAIEEVALVVPGTSSVDVPELARPLLPYVVAASEGQADFLVTGYPDLLVLGDFSGVQIVNPLGFLQHVRLLGG